MANQNPTGLEHLNRCSPAVEDVSTESAVLGLLLSEHPARLTVDELGLCLHADREQADPDDAAERAVRELVGAGLVHRDGRFLAPSRAALYFASLKVI